MGLCIGWGRCLAPPSDHELWISQLITDFTMLCYTMICDILWYSMLYNAIQCYTRICNAIKYYTMLYNAIRWYTMTHNALIYNTIQCYSTDHWLNHRWVIPPMPQFTHSPDLTLERNLTSAAIEIMLHYLLHILGHTRTPKWINLWVTHNCNQWYYVSSPFRLLHI